MRLLEDISIEEIVLLIFAEDIDLLTSKEQPATSHDDEFFSLFEDMIIVKLYLALKGE